MPMYNVKTKNGISDISSSEGRLRRFTLLCKIIKSENGLTRRKLENLVKKEIGSPFQNKTVTQRHLAILEEIGLIESSGGFYTLSSDGKALCELVSDSQVITPLSFEEQVIYLKALFTSSLKNQLMELLEVVRLHPHESRKEIINNYFLTELAQSLWNKTTIEKNLKRLHESGRIPSFFENKFRCMEMWLEDTGLIKKEKNRILLKSSVEKFIDEIKKRSIIKNEIYGLIGMVLLGYGTLFDYSKHREEFLARFKEAYLIFKSELDISDIRAIMTYVCVSLLNNRVIIEEEDFNKAVKSLYSEGIVKSVMLGRDGRPRQVVLSEST
jgi:DNA-binding transcriptional regulator YhcF (GntR family)